MRLEYNKAVKWSVEMSEKPKSDDNLKNDVQVIRNILLGEHLEKFQSQVASLEKELSVLKKENKSLLQELRAENEKRFQELIAKLDQTKNERNEMDDKIRKDYDAQINEIKKRLSDFENGQGSLISSLAGALMEYKDRTGK